MKKKTSLSFTDQKVKSAARALNKAYKNYDLGTANAHDIVANYMGYNTEQARKAGGEPDFYSYGFLDSNEPESFQLAEYGEVRVQKRLLDFKKCNIPESAVPHICDIIEDYLTPDCSYCKDSESKTDPVPVVDPADIEAKGYGIRYEYEHDEQKWVCKKCVDEDEGEHFGKCEHCGELFPIHGLDSKGLCPEHKGERDFSEEEMEDRESYMEYIENHS